MTQPKVYGVFEVKYFKDPMWEDDFTEVEELIRVYSSYELAAEYVLYLTKRQARHNNPQHLIIQPLLIRSKNELDH